MAAISQKAQILAFLQESHDKQPAKAPYTKRKLTEYVKRCSWPSLTAVGLMMQHVQSEKVAVLCILQAGPKKKFVSRSADWEESEPWHAFLVWSGYGNLRVRKTKDN